jgi:putative peptidoglycan lipid II flippase
MVGTIGDQDAAQKTANRDHSTASTSRMSQPPRRHSLARNTAVMALGTLLSRLTGFGRVVALAYALNFTRLTDTYNLANNAPNIVYELVLGGVLSATLVPVFVARFASESDEDAWHSVSAVCTIAIAVLAFLTVALYFTSPWVIDLYTVGNSTQSAAEQRRVATELLRMFAPQVAIYGFISVATGILQAKRKFGPPMFAPIFNNLVVIAVLLSLPHISHDLSLDAIQHNQKALYFLGLGTTAGVLAMGVLLVPYLMKNGGANLRWRWNPRHSAVITMLRMSGWTAGFVAANQIALWVTLVLADGNSGDVSAFLSAYTFFILPHGIFAVSVMNALQPDMAEHWIQNKVSAFREQTVMGLRLITAVMIPAGVGYALLAHPISQAILMHGKLSAGEAHTTGSVLAWMAVGLPGFSVFIYLTRAFQSMQDARTVFFLYLFENGLNVITALAFYGAMGVNGLALSQSVSYALAAIAGLWALRRRTQGLQGHDLANAELKVMAASLVMAAVTWLSIETFSSNAAVEVLAAVILSSATYLVMARALRISELQVLLRRRARNS